MIGDANWASAKQSVPSPDIESTSFARDRSRPQDLTARRKENAARDRSTPSAIADRCEFLQEKDKAAKAANLKAKSKGGKDGDDDALDPAEGKPKNPATAYL